MRHKGLFSGARARRPRAAGLRRSVRRLCLCLAVTTMLCVAMIGYRVAPLVRSYGYELFYYLFAPGWLRWLHEPPPRIIIPRQGTKPGSRPVGTERWGDYTITRVSTSPNVTLVHDFLTPEECAFLRNLGKRLKMVAGTNFPVTNAAVGANGLFASFYAYVYSLVRTSHGEYADYHKVDEGDRAKVLAIARKAEAITGLEVGNSEVPFLQHYKASNRFRAHYDMYNVDMTKPFPYRDNYRSTTLLAYLNDVPPGGGGETEFMMATPRPFTVPPREGAALVWANCELENVPTIDTRRPGDVWDEGRCMGGAGPHDMAAYSPGPMPGERVQRPCCIGREFRSLHQSRPVTRGAEKWTMTMWMHQRFTDESRQFADVFGYDGFPGQSASDDT